VLVYLGLVGPGLLCRMLVRRRVTGRVLDVGRRAIPRVLVYLELLGLGLLCRVLIARRMIARKLLDPVLISRGRVRPGLVDSGLVRTRRFDL